jgi:hypothetical protein
MARKSEAQRLKEADLAAKIRVTEARAARIERENAIKSGEYVPKIEVEADAAETATRVIRVLSMLPARLAGMCAGADANRIYAIVQREVQTAVDTLQLSAFLGDLDAAMREKGFDLPQNCDILRTSDTQTN